MAQDFITMQRVAFGDLAPQYAQLEELYTSKQWYQLTSALLQFVQNTDNNRGDNFIQLYESFISTFEGRLNQLHLQQLVARIAEQFYPSRPYVAAELDRALDLLNRQIVKRTRSGEERLQDDAFLVASMESTSLKIKKATALAGEASSGSEAAAAALETLLDECKKELGEGKALLDSMPEGRDPLAIATYHRASSEYFKLRGPAHSFYEAALLYLGNTPLESLSRASQVGLAVDIAIAALVGDNIYNFGEVNAHPVLAALRETEHAWLVSLLKSFQNGDIDAFNAVVGANKGAYSAQVALEACTPVVKEKITLLAVMELAARKPAGERSISFVELSHETRLPVEQVEWVLMRAMSLALIKGTIDEVEQVVNVSFVKPRVLDTVQLEALKERVDTWREKARTSLLLMEDHTREIFA